MNIRLFCGIFLMLCLQLPAWAEDAHLVYVAGVPLGDQRISPDVPVHLASAAYSIADVKKHAHDADFWEGNPGFFSFFESQEIWVKVPLRNQNSSSFRLILSDQWSLTNDITAFLVQGQQVIAQNHDGGFSPVTHRPFRYRFPSFGFDIPPGDSVIYLRYRSNDLPGVRLRVAGVAAFERSMGREQLLLGLVFGGLLIMALYNLFISIALRSKAYLFYGVYVISFLFFQGFHSGVFYREILDNNFVMEHGTIVFAALAIIFVVKFTNSFLDIDQNFPVIYHCGCWLIRFLYANTLILFVDFQIAAYMIISANFLVVGWIILVAGIMSFQGFLLAKIYLTAWISFVVLDLFSVLYYVNLLDYSLLSEWGMMLGSIVEATLISFALATRVYLLKKQASLSQINEARMRQGMEVARSIQDSLITVNLPATIHHDVTYLPAEMTAGDWIHLDFDPETQRFYGIVADVTGHGVGSALITAAVSGAVKASLLDIKGSQISREDALRTLARLINRVVFESSQEHEYLMTANLVCIDIRSGEGSFINAGHIPAYIRRNDQQTVDSLFTRGSILGLRDEPKLRAKSFAVAPGDRLLLATDGLFENEIGPGLTIQPKQVMADFATNRPLVKVRQSVLARSEEYWQEHTLADDVTMVLLEFPKAG
jgi:serine phosphatase RsbU (regulator of sigma subunit)